MKTYHLCLPVLIGFLFPLTAYFGSRKATAGGVAVAGANPPSICLRREGGQRVLGWIRRVLAVWN